MSKRISVTQAAKIMGISAQMLRIALQREKIDSGVAINGNGEKYTYIIYPEKLKEYYGQD